MRGIVRRGRERRDGEEREGGEGMEAHIEGD